jgi:hypothetical protein
MEQFIAGQLIEEGLMFAGTRMLIMEQLILEQLITHARNRLIKRHSQILSCWVRRANYNILY